MMVEPYKRCVLSRMKTSKLKFSTLLLLLGICFTSRTVIAADSNWFYLEADATRATVTVAKTDFKPVLPRYKLGVFITQGFLLEAQYTGSGDDTVDNSNVEIENISAAYLRLDSGIRSSMRMYVLLGSAETKLNVKGSGGATAGTDTYKDFSWGIGIEDRTWSKHTLLTLEYTEYFKSDDVIISAVSLGFKFEY